MRRRFISRVVNAFGVIDAANDFGSSPKSAIQVPNGNDIGPVIGKVQEAGVETGFFCGGQFEVRDAHKPTMFSFLENNRASVRKGIFRVPDDQGNLHTLLPRHMIPNTWGFQLLEGVREDLFDIHFRKGEDPGRDQFSAATPEVVRWLQQQGVTDIYLAGHLLRICVGTSAINFAHDNKFRVHIVSDACGDNPELTGWANVLELMDKYKIEHITSDQLIERMRKQAQK